MEQKIQTNVSRDAIKLLKDFVENQYYVNQAELIMNEIVYPKHFSTNQLRSSDNDSLY